MKKEDSARRLSRQDVEFIVSGLKQLAGQAQDGEEAAAFGTVIFRAGKIRDALAVSEQTQREQLPLFEPGMTSVLSGSGWQAFMPEGSLSDYRVAWNPFEIPLYTGNGSQHYIHYSGEDRKVGEKEYYNFYMNFQAAFSGDERGIAVGIWEEKRKGLQREKIEKQKLQLSSTVEDGFITSLIGFRSTRDNAGGVILRVRIPSVGVATHVQLQNVVKNK